MPEAVRSFLRAPDTGRRLARCVTGLVLCGIGFSLLVQADLGLDPWDVFHQGVSDRTGLPIGVVAIITGFVLWNTGRPAWIAGAAWLAAGVLFYLVLRLTGRPTEVADA